MTENDRRRQARIKVRFPCELVFGRERASGMVQDLSPGGLSVESDSSAEQGDSVFVRLHPKGRSSIDIETLVWSVCGMRRRSTGKTSTRLGLVISEAPDEFLDLLKSEAPASVAQPAEPPQARSPEPEAAKEAEPPPAERRFYARVKQSATSRTRTILVFAESAEDAAKKALAEAGAGWSLLDVASR